MTEPLLLTNKVSAQYLIDSKKIAIKAVDGVSLQLFSSGSLGLVGESGCGKTTLGRLIAGLLKPSDGSVMFRGRPVVPGQHLPDLQMVFQDPYSSLNPRISIQGQLEEGLRNFRLGDRAMRLQRINEALVSVDMPSDCLSSYPHQLSGGQLQRICLARTLVLRPKLLVLDEPTSALDAPVQSQLLALLLSLIDEYGLSYIIISHNLAVIRQVCDSVAVMYLGRLIEVGPVAKVFNSPRHFYTAMLLDSYLPPDPLLRKNKTSVKGTLPNPLKPPAGCRFHPRCSHAVTRCRTTPPLLREVVDDHFCACHFSG
ncbi:MAG: ABC transporter ATP-binding protein [Dethiobacter sp.]|jgi:peptide/nickel transport system ATP-binding protein|nr:ABC transporter ATP-binding protein [Dethiobacter sp.]